MPVLSCQCLAGVQSALRKLQAVLQGRRAAIQGQHQRALVEVARLEQSLVLARREVYLHEHHLEMADDELEKLAQILTGVSGVLGPWAHFHEGPFAP